MEGGSSILVRIVLDWENDISIKTKNPTKKKNELLVFHWEKEWEKKVPIYIGGDCWAGLEIASLHGVNIELRDPGPKPQT